MKLRYYPETHSLYIELAHGTSVDAAEIADGVVADFDAEGKILGLEMEDASKFDLSTLEAVNFPATPVAVSA